MTPDKIFISVNGRTISLETFAKMDVAIVKTVNVSGCTGLTSLPDLPAAKTVDVSGCTGLTSLPDLPAAEYVDVSGCTGLTSLPDLPAAKTVNVSGCTGLTSLPDLPAAKTVNVSGCTGLTSLPDLPAAEYVDARGASFCIDVGKNARGYPMWAVPIRGQWRVMAGCRNFSVEEARRHWGPGSARAHKSIAAQVEEIAAEIERRSAVAQ